MKLKSLYLTGISVLAAALLSGCFHDEDDTDKVSYEVTVTNLTEAQPLSPFALIVHREGYHIWQVGVPASEGLEQLAEGGTASPLVAEAEADATVMSTASDVAAIPPGGSSSLLIKSNYRRDIAMSLATMLVNTNDGFTGLEAIPIAHLARHESLNITVAAYDAGTEANTETAATVPGPAAGGEGFNAVRDDRDTVGGHPGVISSDDGLNGSALDASHRFDNPVAHISITRLN